jgi:hypothetical protein
VTSHHSAGFPLASPCEDDVFPMFTGGASRIKIDDEPLLKLGDFHDRKPE